MSKYGRNLDSESCTRSPLRGKMTGFSCLPHSPAQPFEAATSSPTQFIKVCRAASWEVEETGIVSTARPPDSRKCSDNPQSFSPCRW